MVQDKQRGGPRKGAGRKAQPESEKRVPVTLSVSPESRTLMNTLRRRKINISRIFDDSIKAYCKDRNIVPSKQDEHRKQAMAAAGRKATPSETL
ncbi:MAG: hypothetical protein IJ161_01680 [Bacteroidales bacterium]|nr:hypothetical protein [Bacteroidales bacterium]